MNLVSIIIPMYNEKSNVENCIRNLNNQKNQNFDVLFIDDGSTDCTFEELESIISLGVDFNYKMFRQDNKGAAAAREVGINLASTKYIMLYDCDDSLSDDTIEELYNIFERDNTLDIILPNMSIENENSEWKDFEFYTNDLYLNSSECVIESLRNWGVHGCLVIKKEIIMKSYLDYYKHNIDRENYINNDEVITRLNFSNSNKIIRSSSFYYYNFNKLSTTRKINNKRYLTIKNSLILNKIYNDDEKIRCIVRSELISNLWGNLYYMYKNKNDLNNKIEWQKTIYPNIEEIKIFETMKSLEPRRVVQLFLLKIANTDIIKKII